MTRAKADLLASIYAVIDAAVILAPAVVLRLDAAASDVAPDYGLDLLLGSGLVALVHAVVAWRRLRRTATHAVRRADVWIAALDALVVLSLAATGLLLAVLVGFADLHTRLATAGWPVIALWIGVQAAAVVLAELVGRGVFKWLEPRTVTEP